MAVQLLQSTSPLTRLRAWEVDRFRETTAAAGEPEAPCPAQYFPGRDDAGGPATMKLDRWWNEVALTRPHSDVIARGTAQLALGAGSGAAGELRAASARSQVRTAAAQRVGLSASQLAGKKRMVEGAFGAAGAAEAAGGSGGARGAGGARAAGGAGGAGAAGAAGAMGEEGGEGEKEMEEEGEEEEEEGEEEQEEEEEMEEE